MLPFCDTKSVPVLTLTGALLLVAVGACATAPTATETTGSATTTGQAETRVTLAIGQSVSPNGFAAEVTLVDVTDDSRCPTGANCVWAGDATVTLRVRPTNGQAESIALHTSGPEARAGQAAGLRLTLERLDPLPTAGQATSRDDYRVAILISR